MLSPGDTMRLSFDALGSHRLRSALTMLGLAMGVATLITVVTLIEHGGHGGAAAAPIARKVLENYYLRMKGIHPSQFAMALEASPESRENR